MKLKRCLAAHLFVILCFACRAYGQNDTSTVMLRGYVVRQFKKQEVTDRATNAQKGIIPIDGYLRLFFIPFSAPAFNIASDSLNILNRNRIIFLPSEETNELIATYCKDKTALIRKTSITYDTATYFKKKKDELYLYQYYFIDGRAIKTIIPNTPRNCHELNLPYNKSYQHLTCYFIYDAVVLQPILKISDPDIVPFNPNDNYLPHETGHILKDH